ncbi:MAG: hypothetical protein ACR2OZ_15110 [Verrucomicrobiales bacterium]
MPESITDKLLTSEEPSVRWKVLLQVCGGNSTSAETEKLRREIRTSRRVKQLLSERDADGSIPFHPYAKWYGAHWVLASLADLGYPPGDRSLVPLREQVYQWLFSERHQAGIRCIAGRVRRCASQEGNAVYYLLSLGLADERTEALVERLRAWQWPDGGWNCDVSPKAVNSSFMESLIPLRALALHARTTGNKHSEAAARCAAEVFLKRRLFKRQQDGSIISMDFIRLHYPWFWRYDVLFGLKVMAEANFLSDHRCHDALGLLEKKRLADGGFAAEGKYYRVTKKLMSGRSVVDWGGASKSRMNEFVTVEALSVLKQAESLPTTILSSPGLNHEIRASDDHRESRSNG